MSQTTRAHRLCQKAYQLGGQDLQIPLLCAIFKAHMEEGQDIADNDVLATLAEKTRVMSKAEVRILRHCHHSAHNTYTIIFRSRLSFFFKKKKAIAFLESDQLEKEVNAMCDDVRSKGVTGVPMTIIDGKWAVSGGQSSDVFVQVSQTARKCVDSANHLLIRYSRNLLPAMVHTTRRLRSQDLSSVQLLLPKCDCLLPSSDRITWT